MKSEAAPKTRSVTLLSSQVPTVVAVAGGLAAQAPDPVVAWTGLVVAAGGLITGIIRALPAFYQWTLDMRRVDLQIAQLRAGITNAHERIDDVQGQSNANAATLAAIAPEAAR